MRQGNPFAEVLPAGNDAGHIWYFARSRGVDDLLNGLYLLCENNRRKAELKTLSQKGDPLTQRERRQLADRCIKQARQLVQASEEPGIPEDVRVSALVAVYAGLLLCYMGEAAVENDQSTSPKRCTAFAYTRRLELRMRRLIEQDILDADHVERSLMAIREAKNG